MELEYEEPPRGRVVYDANEKRFTLLADKCILRDRRIVREIISAMNLPVGTATATDHHYRCHTCLYGKDEEGEDWSG
jgi:hypothetical protein